MPYQKNFDFLPKIAFLFRQKQGNRSQRPFPHHSPPIEKKRYGCPSYYTVVFFRVWFLM